MDLQTIQHCFPLMQPTSNCKKAFVNRLVNMYKQNWFHLKLQMTHIVHDALAKWMETCLMVLCIANWYLLFRRGAALNSNKPFCYLWMTCLCVIWPVSICCALYSTLMPPSLTFPKPFVRIVILLYYIQIVFAHRLIDKLGKTQL